MPGATTLRATEGCRLVPGYFPTFESQGSRLGSVAEILDLCLSESVEINLSDVSGRSIRGNILFRLLNSLFGSTARDFASRPVESGVYGDF